jgi:hypothetical protein
VADRAAYDGGNSTRFPAFPESTAPTATSAFAIHATLTSTKTNFLFSSNRANRPHPEIVKLARYT